MWDVVHWGRYQCCQNRFYILEQQEQMEWFCLTQINSQFKYHCSALSSFAWTRRFSSCICNNNSFYWFLKKLSIASGAWFGCGYFSVRPELKILAKSATSFYLLLGSVWKQPAAAWWSLTLMIWLSAKWLSRAPEKCTLQTWIFPWFRSSLFYIVWIEIYGTIKII